MTRHRWRHLGLALLALLLAAGCVNRAPAVGDTDRTTFAVAGALYAAGNYAEAAALYEQLLAQRYSDGALYYNLGNAYYRSADYGRAILNYRRALLLLPRNADVRANLTRARAQTVDRLAAPASDPLVALARVGDRLTLNELAGVALAVWLLWAAGWAVYRAPAQPIRHERRRTALQSTLAVGGVLLLLLLVLLGSRLLERRVRPPAVVVAAEVAVSATLQQSANPLFVLHSGAEVGIIRRQGRWVEVVLPGDALRGWLPADAVVAIHAAQGEAAR